MGDGFPYPVDQTGNFAAIQSANPTLEQLRPFGYAPGGYTMKCPACQGQVHGVDKRAWRCWQCAVNAFRAEEAKPPAVREAEQMHATLDRLTMLRAFQGARRLAKRKRDPNWVFAMEMFGLGSTYAWAMCKRMGLDPDSTSADQQPASDKRVVG
ncbi:hypothetical protein [Methylobacterium sp. yr596]|uniref:hypothetical protein n=1 Tax=Methylobacterium sp. yr596 TaxID=1761800 RepID=UPI0008F1113A|nr:hypothetical protein [Methylobacterium sp. yr596]SFF17190.1 hypothetical protein SAMN04487844_11116 [Methylobacterium sp. yr596]